MTEAVDSSTTTKITDFFSYSTVKRSINPVISSQPHKKEKQKPGRPIKTALLKTAASQLSCATTPDDNLIILDNEGTSLLEADQGQYIAVCCVYVCACV